MRCLIFIFTLLALALPGQAQSRRLMMQRSAAAGVAQTNALTPTFSPNGGLTHTAALTNVVITSAGPPGVKIFWTTNGSTPSTNLPIAGGPTYGGVTPQTVTGMVAGTLKAIAWTNDAYTLPSATASAAFTNEAGASCDSINDASLVLYMKFDEASGTRTDAKNGYTFADNNTVTSVAGKISNAAEFTSANTEYLGPLADNANVSMSGTFTIDFWVYLKSTRNHGIISKANEYWIETTSDQIHFQIIDSVSSSIEVLSTEHLSNDTWYHVECWYDHAGDKKARIAINNGTAAVSAAALSNGPNDSTADVYLGLASGGASLANGYLEELLVTKRVLTADEKTARNAVNSCRPSGL